MSQPQQAFCPRAKSGSAAPLARTLPPRSTATGPSLPRKAEPICPPRHLPPSPIPLDVALGPSPTRLPALTRSGQVTSSSSPTVEDSEQFLRAYPSFHSTFVPSEVRLVAFVMQAHADRASLPPESCFN